MIKQAAIVTITLALAFSILFISVLRTASVKYSFHGESASLEDEYLNEEHSRLENMQIEYYLPYEGSVTPEHPLWPLKALRDRVWLMVITDPYKKAEVNLLFADKRLGAAYKLFQDGEYDAAYTTLTKAEKYLENACKIEAEIRSQGGETLSLADRLISASLKHRQVIEQILLIAPDDAKSKIEVTKEYSVNVYADKKGVLEKAGTEVPENPFNGD